MKKKFRTNFNFTRFFLSLRIMGSVDTNVSTFNYTDGSFNDIVEGIEVTITETNESFQNNKNS